VAYNHDPADGSSGTLRSLIDDTSELVSPVKNTDYYFSDAELLAFLDLNSDDLWLAAADACRSLAVKFAKKAQIIGLGKQDIYIDLKKKSEYYIQLAKSFSNRSDSAVNEYVDSFSYDVNDAGNDNSEYIGD